jgi:hypothetical protein
VRLPEPKPQPAPRTREELLEKQHRATDVRRQVLAVLLVVVVVIIALVMFAAATGRTPSQPRQQSAPTGDG